MMSLPCFSSARARARTSNADSVPIRDIFSASFIGVLHERRSAPLPAFAFFFRYHLDVPYVRRALREDVVQVVAETHEGETLLEELADARGAEQENPKDDAVLSGGGLELLRCVVELRRGVHVRELVLLEESHRHT